MRRPVSLWLLIALACLSSAVGAQVSEPRLVSLSTAGNSPFERLATLLTRATGETYGVDPALAQHRVDLALVKVPLDKVAETSVRHLATIIPGLVVEKEKTGWLFRLRDGAPVPPVRKLPPPVAACKVTVIFGGVRLRQLVGDLFAEVPGVRKPSPYVVEVEKSVPNVPIDLQHTANNEDLILSLVTRQAASSEPGIALEQSGNRFKVGIHPGSRPQSGLFPRLIPLEAPTDRRIICAFDGFPFKSAAQMVVAHSTVPCGPLLRLEAADPLPEAQITFRKVTNDPEALLRSFLEAARKQIRGLGFTRTDDTIVLTYRRP